MKAFARRSPHRRHHQDVADCVAQVRKDVLRGGCQGRRGVGGRRWHWAVRLQDLLIEPLVRQVLRRQTLLCASQVLNAGFASPARGES